MFQPFYEVAHHRLEQQGEGRVTRLPCLLTTMSVGAVVVLNQAQETSVMKFRLKHFYIIQVSIVADK